MKPGLGRSSDDLLAGAFGLPRAEAAPDPQMAGVGIYVAPPEGER